MNADRDGLDAPSIRTGSGTGPAALPDPWLNFTFASDDDPGRGGAPGEAALFHASWPDEGSECDLAHDLDAAGRLGGDLFQLRQRGDSASQVAGDAPGAARDRSITSSLPGPTPTCSLSNEASNRQRFLRLPEVGDTLFGFRLRYPLGRGAFARVFLAEQADLGGRPVVLKISAIEGTEPQTPAQFPPTTIVPIHSVHEDQNAGLRAVCMPYFGGASLSCILQKVWAAPEAPERGDALTAALLSVQSPPPARSRNGIQLDLRIASADHAEA